MVEFVKTDHEENRGIWGYDHTALVNEFYDEEGDKKEG